MTTVQIVDTVHAASQVRVAQMDNLARMSPSYAVVGQFTILIVSGCLWPRAPHGYLIAFPAVMSVTYTVLVVLGLRWRLQRRTSQEPGSFWPLITVMAFLGVEWGAMPVAFLGWADAGGQQVVGYVCAGLIGVGPMLAPVLPAALLFSGFISAGAVVALLLQEGPVAHVLILLVLGYGGLIAFGILDLNARFSERVMANIQLEEQREIIGLLLRDFEESSSDWLWQTDTAGRLTGVSDHLARVIGLPDGTGDGTLLLSLGIDNGQNEDVRRLSNCLAQPAAFRDLSLPVMVGDEPRWLSLTGKPIHGRDGAFRGFRGVGADVTTARFSAARINYLATTDSLTDLPNRATLGEALGKAYASHKPFALLCLDLDGFKVVNDTYGHSAGDALLVAAAGRMRHCLREGDVLARLGGDEFAVVQANGDAGTSETLARRLNVRLAEPFALGANQIVIGASVGIALAPADGATPEILFKAADLALYGAKNNGRGNWRFFESELETRVQLRTALQADLRQALARGELSLNYQPICDIDSGQVLAMEALMRWHHPVHGAVSPADFIPLAEESGMIVALGAWALGQACIAAAGWDTPVQIAVNLSTVQVRDPGLLRTVDKALAMAGLPATRLELEITESLFLEATHATRACLHALRARGIRIALDDFGTGYSSLSYLRSFPFDKVKIDRSFVSDVADDISAAALVQAITGMADSLGMATIVEGVETQQQRAVLQARGCRQVQGYLFSRPMTPEVAANLLQVGNGLTSDFLSVKRYTERLPACSGPVDIEPCRVAG